MEGTLQLHEEHETSLRRENIIKCNHSVFSWHLIPQICLRLLDESKNHKSENYPDITILNSLFGVCLCLSL